MADKKVKSTIDPETWAAYKRNDILTEVNGLMRNAYLQYSVSANIGRAIPDVRDGLKPGARRILYAMLRGHFGSAGGTNKCAKVVGLVIGNYHPHGDAAVYDTMVRMAQDFSMRVPLIYGHGNFGSMDGDPPAAYRYTECKMNKSAEILLSDLDMNTVDMRDTFDAKELEPTVLPAAFPNLLVNGSQGIGVGMATNIPPHNPVETIDAAIAVIDNPNISLDELMDIIPGPDFPTGGVIHGKSGIHQFYSTGQGTLRVRGKVVVETDKNGKDTIVITEIPYGVNKAEMVSRIGEMVRENLVHGVSSVNDYSSSRVGVRIVIELKSDATANVVINELYKLTPLESTNACQMLVIDHNRPRTMTLRQVIDAYIDHREEVIRRRTQFELDKAQARAHIVDGLLIAQANIDEIIRIIRSSNDSDEAKAQLISRYGLDDIQSDAILAMRLSQLTHLAIDELQKEKAELEQEINRLTTILSCRANVMAVVRQELLEVRASKELNTPRRTRIEAAPGADGLDELTKREIYVITLTRSGYIKRCSADEYEAQNRGGSGVKGITARKEGDRVQMILSTRSHNSLLFFTNFGKVYRMSRAYNLPECGRADAGRFISNVLTLYANPENPEDHEEIRAIIPYDEKNIDFDNTYIVMITANGIIKRCSLSLFKNLKKSGKRAITFKENDDLIDAILTDGTGDLLISSKGGRALRFPETAIRVMGNTASGVKTMKLKTLANGEKDCVVSMTSAIPENQLLVITANGYGKRTPIGMGKSDDAPAEASISDDEQQLDADIQAIEENQASDENQEADAVEDTMNNALEERSQYRYRRTGRVGQGCISIKLRDGDKVISAMQLAPDCDKDLLLLSEIGQAVRIPVSQVPTYGRPSQGVIIMRMSKEGDKVVNVSIVDRLSTEDQEANEAKARNDEKNAAEAEAFDAKLAQEKNEILNNEQDASETDVDAPSIQPEEFTTSED